jgi:hypothetical protein
MHKFPGPALQKKGGKINFQRLTHTHSLMGSKKRVCTQCGALLFVFRFLTKLFFLFILYLCMTVTAFFEFTNLENYSRNSTLSYPVISKKIIILLNNIKHNE